MATTWCSVARRERLRFALAHTYPGSSPLRSAVPVVVTDAHGRTTPAAAGDRFRLANPVRTVNPVRTANPVHTDKLVPTQAVGMVPGRRPWSPPV